MSLLENVLQSLHMSVNTRADNIKYNKSLSRLIITYRYTSRGVLSFLITGNVYYMCIPNIPKRQILNVQKIYFRIYLYQQDYLRNSLFVFEQVTSIVLHSSITLSICNDNTMNALCYVQPIVIYDEVLYHYNRNVITYVAIN